jgi:ABC-type branched-subunit amino acid transport system permease subunit
MIALATQTLPEGSHSGYVAAAYIVFFVLVLVYVAIMAWRLTRVERSVRALRTPQDAGRASELRAGERGGDGEGEREKEAV